MNVAKRIATRIAVDVAMNAAILACLRAARGGSSGSLVPQMARKRQAQTANLLRRLPRRDPYFSRKARIS